MRDNTKMPIAQQFSQYNKQKGRKLTLIDATSNISGNSEREKFFVHNGGRWIRLVDGKVVK